MSESESYEQIPLSESERLAFLERVRCVVTADDYRRIEAQSRAVPALLAHIADKNMSLRRLRKMIFGPHTEKTAAVCPPPAPAPGAVAPSPKPKRKGHGRRKVAAHIGARRVGVSHPSLRVGSPCPKCDIGKVRSVPPTVILRVYANAPLSAIIHELEKFRCNRCGETFSAPPPPEAGTQKYDPNVGPMLGILRYGTGVPNYRMERLQQSLGVPLPASTQWELTEETARLAAPAFDELLFQAAQYQLLHNDDTPMRVASLRKQIKAEIDPKRTGIFTSSVMAVAASGDHPIALFFTGRQHAGENLDQVLQRRCPTLPVPLQMCDALSRNVPKACLTRLGNCLSHGRRTVVEVAPNFPDESRYILEAVREVYRYDAQARNERLSPEARLFLHQTHSRPILEDLHRWFRDQIDQKRVEPNSGIGNAIGYFLTHWEPLTLFLRQPGAPLDNNLAERALKMAIMHRKNSLGYKTERGAEVGDLFMSLIHTCRLNGVNPFDYLTSLVRNPRAVEADPTAWLPWNYPRPVAPTDHG